jgi:VanZ family protein
MLTTATTTRITAKTEIFDRVKGYQEIDDTLDCITCVHADDMNRQHTEQQQKEHLLMAHTRKRQALVPSVQLLQQHEGNNLYLLQSNIIFTPYCNKKQNTYNNTSTTRNKRNMFLAMTASCRSSTMMRSTSKKNLFSIHFVLLICLLYHVSLSTAYLYIPNYLGSRSSSSSSSSSTTMINDDSTNSSSSSSDMISYEILPALFGRYMVNNHIYNARIQYWPENPYLCSSQPHTSFRHSIGITIPTHTHTSSSQNSNNNNNNDNSGGSDDVQDDTASTKTNNNSNDGIQLPGDPIVLLVARGNCPFSEKAIQAQTIDPQIMFLAVYNTDETLVSMSADTSTSTTINPFYSGGSEEDGTDDYNFYNTDSGSSSSDSSSSINLVLFSISHSTGQAIKHYIANQTIDVLENGGPLVQLDSNSKDTTTYDMNDFIALVVSALGFLLFILSCIGCIIIFVATYGQVRIVNNNGRIVIVMSTGANNTTIDSTTNNNNTGHDGTILLDATNAATTTRNDGSSVATTASVFNLIAGNPRRLLTIDEVRQLQQRQQQQQQNNSDQGCLLVPSSSSTDMLRHPQPSNTEQASAMNNNSSDNDSTVDFINYDNCCSICLDDLSSSTTRTTSVPDEQQQQQQQDDNILILPCSHKFHYNTCIVPWLTQRQSKCPLCKYDIYQYVRNNYCCPTNTTTTTTSNSDNNNSNNNNNSNGIIMIQPTTTEQQNNNYDDDGVFRTIDSTRRTANIWNQIRSTISGAMINSSSNVILVSTNIVDNDDDADVELTTTTTTSTIN